MSECVARCAPTVGAGGIPAAPIAARGYCPGDDSVRFAAAAAARGRASPSPSSSSREAGERPAAASSSSSSPAAPLLRVPARVLYAYADEGYAYLGRVRLADPPAQRRLFVASVAAAHAAAARDAASGARAVVEGAKEAGRPDAPPLPREQAAAGPDAAALNTAGATSSGGLGSVLSSAGGDPSSAAAVGTQEVEIRRATSTGDVYSRVYSFVPGSGPFSYPPFNPTLGGASLARLFAAESSGPVSASVAAAAQPGGGAAAATAPGAAGGGARAASPLPSRTPSPPPPPLRAPAQQQPLTAQPFRVGGGNSSGSSSSTSVVRGGATAPPAARPPTPNLRPEVGSVAAASSEGALAATAPAPEEAAPPAAPGFVTFSSSLLPELQKAASAASAAAAAGGGAPPAPTQQQQQQQQPEQQQRPRGPAGGVLDGLGVPLGALVVNPFKGLKGRGSGGGGGHGVGPPPASAPASAAASASAAPAAEPAKRWGGGWMRALSGGGAAHQAAAAAAPGPGAWGWLFGGGGGGAGGAARHAGRRRLLERRRPAAWWPALPEEEEEEEGAAEALAELDVVDGVLVDPSRAAAAAAAPADERDEDEEEEEDEDEDDEEEEQDLPPPPSSSSSSSASADRADLARAQRALRSIIGAVDSRRPCPVGQWPYTSLGQITSLAVDGDFLCSGALVGPDRVLTAAHCVWDDRDARTFFRDLSFAPAQYKTPGGVVRAPVGKVAWEHVTILQAYADDPNFAGLAFDVAVIKLKQPVGDALGWLGYRAACEGASGDPLSLTLAGYPGNAPKSRADDAFLGGCYADACGVLYDCRAGTNNHTCDSYVGQSGAPMWDKGGYARMVHTLGVLPGFSTTNAGVTLTPFLVEMISRFM